MRKIVFYQGKTQYSNTGDALINKSLMDHFRRYAHIILNDGGMPFYYLEELEMRQDELSGKGGSSFIWLLIKCGFINLFKREFQLYFLATPPGHQFGGGVKNFVKQLVLVFIYALFKMLNIRVIKIGFSIGPIDKGAEILERWKSRFISFYYVRDPISLGLVHRIIIAKAKFFPDLAWTYVAEGKPTARDSVFISFRSQVVTGIDGRSYASDLIQKIKILVTDGLGDLNVVIGYQVKEDRDFCKLLYEEIKSVRSVEFRDQQIMLATADVFSSYKFMLTNRLHVALLGYQYGALPVILSDIGKHQKIKGIFEHAGVSQLLLDVNHDSKVLLDSISYLHNTSEAIRQKLLSTQIKYDSLSKRIIHDIFSTNH